MRILVPLAAALSTLLLPVAALAQVPGDLDPDFGTGGYTVVDITVDGNPMSNSATGLALDAGGRVVMSGSAGPIGAGESRMIAVRLTAGGIPDGSFGSNGRVRVDALTGRTDEVYYDGRLALAPDGDIYLFNGTQDAGGVIGWALVRLNPGGALDGGFASGGRLTLAGNTLEAGDIAVQADGKPVVYEDFFDTAPTPDNQQTRARRYTTAGAADAAFNGGSRVVAFDVGPTRNDWARAVYVQRDGRILVAGRAETDASGSGNPDFAIARLTPAGALDPTFGGGDGMVTIGFDLAFGNTDEVRALAVDARGRIYAGGIAGNFSTANECAVVRLLPDGTPDPAFGGGDGKVTFHFASALQGAFDQVFGIALQGDGRLVVVGRGTNASGSGRRVGVARLIETGALDPTFAGDGTAVYDFSSGTGSVSVGRAVVLAGDGSIVLSGLTQQTASDNDFVAARLWNDYVFADGFETGDRSAWSAGVP